MYLKNINYNYQLFIVCHDISDEGIKLFAKFPKLESLYLDTMELISDESLKYFTTLKTLECGNCPKIQNEGLYVALQMCESIEKVGISSNARSIDSDIDLLKFTIGVLKSRNNKNNLEVEINKCIVRITPNESSNDSVANLTFEIFDKEENPCFSTFEEEKLLSFIHNM